MIWPSITILAIYITLSLFDIWFHLPVFVQPSFLLLTIIGAYALSKVGLKSGWGRDYGAKYFIILMLATGYVGAQGQAKIRLLEGFKINYLAWGKKPQVSVWVLPPNYTGETQRAIAIKEDPSQLAHEKKQINLLEGSQILVNIEDSYLKPRLALGEQVGSFVLSPEKGFIAAVTAVEDDKLHLNLGAGMTMTWEINVSLDSPASIKFLTTPRSLPNNYLEVGVLSQDNYPTELATFNIRKAGSEGGKVFSYKLSPQYEIMGKDGYYQLDLTSNIWAGTTVLGWLTVNDAMGQTSISKILQFTLPVRLFKNHVAQEVISIRKSLLLGGSQKDVLRQRLIILANNKSDFNNDYVVYSALKTAYWRLNFPGDNVESIAELLWGAAVKLEESVEDQLAYRH